MFITFFSIGVGGPVFWRTVLSESPSRVCSNETSVSRRRPGRIYFISGNFTSTTTR